ncbi:E3 ubiquitin protein ligase RIE1-like [Henckelia pumila]|uniref:E3 ubiquitin protein ligase RIE1-like n=1 Tax=Henckelia pumila TaxID=405737 RepID=UPI003C6E70F6
MDQEYHRFFRGGDDLGPTRNSMDTSLTLPFARIATSSEQHRILVDDEPEIYSIDDDDGEDDDLAAQIRRDCGYSKPFLFLDMIWNLAFVLVSVFVILTTIQERPSTPLRLWISGYALQCFLHMGFVWAEYQRPSIDDDFEGFQDFHFHGVFSSLCHNRIIQKLESVNTVLSSIWWVFGFYWIVMGGQLLLQDSPHLYWLSVVFLAFDVFFLVFCIVVACIVFLVLFCCFPILATVAYAMTIGDGASENDIRSLPKYLYRHQSHTFENERKQVQLTPLSSHSNSMTELVLPPEDSECCICLYKYIDGVELCSLPCNHHFHHKCIAKWLRINATCPLCKLNILRGDMLV